MHRGLTAAVGGATLVASLAVGVTAFGSIGQSAALASRASARPASVEPLPGAIVIRDKFFTAGAAPTTTQCEQTLGAACYRPTQLERAYDETPLFKKGLNGTGVTIAIVDPYGSPTIQADLATFDSDFGLQAPPSFTVITPVGAVPAWNPAKYPLQPNWAVETSLDVEYSHAMAPGANILLVETPVPETVGVRGFPEIVSAENYVINHHLADVISQSFAAPEAGFPSAQSILDLRGAYKNAASKGVTVVSAAGDQGATGPANASGSTLFTKAAPEWPSSDPLVTSVGGTQLHLNDAGKQLFPANVWNDTNIQGGPAAGGGGLSTVFTRPMYQDGVEGVVRDSRGYPDISLSAAVDGGVLVQLGLPGIPAGLYVAGGTSEATPEFAGIVAIADQAAGHPLGLLNPALYTLAGSAAPGIVDVTTGNDTVSFDQSGKQYTVDGYVAGKGYDLASGLGTINAFDLVRELAGDGHLVSTASPKH